MHNFFRKKRTQDFTWIIVACALLIATAVRIAAIDRRTIHIDEGMGLRASELALQGEWQFYSANGHGPTLFYAGAVVRAFFGDSLIAARGLTVLFGLATIALLLLFLRTRLDRISLLALGAGLGLSSGMVFYHTYFIHESLLVFFTVALIVAVWHWMDTGQTTGIVAAPVFLALMYATKETAILTVGAWVLAFGLVLLAYPEKRALFSRIPWTAVAIGAVLALSAYVLLFSSFFSNPQGIVDSVLAPFHWMERARTHHLRPFHYFFTLLALREFALVAVSLILAVWITVTRRWNALLVFLGSSALFLILIYSLIRYKTPWCAPTMIVFLLLFACIALQRVLATTRGIARSAVYGMLILAGIVMFFGMLQDNFGHPDRIKAYDYAYLQSGESLRTFIHTLEVLSDIHGGGPAMPMQFIGNGEELLHVLTDPYARSYGPFERGFPVYVNYRHSAEDLWEWLHDGSERSYVRAVFTYIQESIQVDLFVEESLWHRYQEDPRHRSAHTIHERLFDYR